MELHEDFIEMTAAMAHELNKAYCISIGDNSQTHWEDAPQWQKDSSINGVKYAIENNFPNPVLMHINWQKEKVADGWVYGEIKDPVAKTHPCIRDYGELPEEQRVKDTIFAAVVRAFMIVTN